MKRFLLIIISLFFLTSFSDRQSAKDFFEVTISYVGLPSSTSLNYHIDSEKLSVFETKYDRRKEQFVKANNKTFKKFDRQRLRNFLNETEWETIPTNLVTPKLDGFQYNVKIVFNDQTIEYKIDNTYHSVFDSLFTICNELIPKKKTREEFHLPYSRPSEPTGNKEYKQHIETIRKVFENYIQYNESTDSPDNKNAMTKSLTSLKVVRDLNDLELLINVWMYYDPTDFQSNPEIYRILLSSRPESIEALMKRIKYKKEWETDETAPYSDLKNLLERLEKE